LGFKNKEMTVQKIIGVRPARLNHLRAFIK